MEFKNYKVLLQLKDGSQIKGLINSVNKTQITVGNKCIDNHVIKDLKVLQLPKEEADGGKRTKKTLEGPNVGTLAQFDQAVVSASKPASRSGTPKLGKKLPDWGSDVQNIKASEDFDFAANLAMFDKETVFADFQKHDQVSASDRLVGHNKVEKKSNGKYENNEMIIPVNKEDTWNNIGSISQRYSLPVNAAGGVLESTKENTSFKFVFENTDVTVPLASPVQFLEIERIMQKHYSLDLRISVETCATNLYKFIANKILGGSVRLSNRNNHNLPPLVLLLIGSSRCSSYSFALGRHLTNHGIRVLAYAISEEHLSDEDVNYQCQLFEKSGGKIVHSDFKGFLDILNQLETPVELIVDSLQGFTTQLSDLFYASADFGFLKQLVNWVNEPRQRSKTLSLDIPSGVDGGSGTVTDPLLHIKSSYVVSLGLPISGLLHAYNNGILVEDVTHFVVDAGIPNAVFSAKPHLRKFDKFWFCAEDCLALLVTK